MRSALVALSAVVLTTPLLAACGDEDDGPFITVYNAQHEELLEEIAPGFDEKTGIEVKLRNGNDFELANQLVQEGDASPGRRLPHRELARDVARRQRRTCSRRSTPRRWRTSRRSTPRATAAGSGFAARSTVLVYNTDAARPRPSCRTRSWTWPTRSGPGRVAFSPTGADFQAIVSAVLRARGRGRHARVAGSRPGRERRPCYDGNNLVVMKAVNAGEVDAGIIYHYYWYRDQEESGENSDDLAAALLRQPGPRRLRQRLRVPACSRRATSRTTPRSSSSTSPARRASRPRRQLRPRVPPQPRRPARATRQAVRRAASRPGSTSRPSNGAGGDRDDAGRGPALSTTTAPPEPTSRTRQPRPGARRRVPPVLLRRRVWPSAPSR